MYHQLISWISILFISVFLGTPFLSWKGINKQLKTSLIFVSKLVIKTHTFTLQTKPKATNLKENTYIISMLLMIAICIFLIISLTEPLNAHKTATMRKETRPLILHIYNQVKILILVLLLNLLYVLTLLLIKIVYINYFFEFFKS